MEDGFALLIGDVDAVEYHRVQVRVEPQVGVGALHDGDGATAASAAAELAHAPAVEAEHRVHEDAADGAEQLPIVAEPSAQLEWHGQHELSQGHGRQHVVDEVRCGLRHPPPEARRTEAASFARKRQQTPFVAVFALEDGKATTQQAAVEVALELATDEVRQRGVNVPVFHGGVEGLQVLTHQLVQRAQLRAPAFVYVAPVGRGRTRVAARP